MPKNKKIFLIEDDEVFAKTLCQTLIKEGYEVSASSRTDFAKNWLTSNKFSFDMIMSDQRLPGELGSEFFSFLAALEGRELEKLESESPLYQSIRKRFPQIQEDVFKGMLKEMKVSPHLRVILSGYLDESILKNALETKVIHGIISKKSSRDQILTQIQKLFESQVAHS